MLSADNQTATTIRKASADATGAAPAYLNFFLDRYTPAYRAELDHLITSVEQGTKPSPDFTRRPCRAGAGRGRRCRAWRTGAAVEVRR